MKRSVFAVLITGGIAVSCGLAAFPASAKTAKECNAEYKDNKAAIKGAGQKKKDFVAACRAGTETIPGGAAGAPAPSPAPVSPAAPPPAATPPAGRAETAPVAPAAPTSAPTPRRTQAGTVGEGGYASDSQAKAHCPADTVVWVNTKSGVYHFAGTHNYGTTKSGTYMCESEAKGAGDRAAQNEKHP